jgi:hypothetical protein
MRTVLFEPSNSSSFFSYFRLSVSIRFRESLRGMLSVVSDLSGYYFGSFIS